MSSSANRFGQPSQPLTVRPVRRPMPTGGPKQVDWDMNGGSMVRCARCDRERARGAACQCERWDAEGRPREMAS